MSDFVLCTCGLQVKRKDMTTHHGSRRHEEAFEHIKKVRLAQKTRTQIWITDVVGTRIQVIEESNTSVNY
jgi:hypothetical protein